MFTAPEGGPLRATHWRQRIWFPAVGASVGELMRFHNLRDSAAVLLMAQGTHPTVIRTRLGHASIRTTLDIYDHLFPASMRTQPMPSTRP